MTTGGSSSPPPSSPGGGTSPRPSSAPPRPGRPADRGVVPPAERTRPARPDQGRRFTPRDPGDRPPPSAPPRSPGGGPTVVPAAPVEAGARPAQHRARAGAHRRVPLRPQRLQPHREDRPRRLAHLGRERHQLPDRRVRLPRERHRTRATPGSTASEAPGRPAGRHDDDRCTSRTGRRRCCRSPATSTCRSPSIGREPQDQRRLQRRPGGRAATLVDTITQSLGIPIDRYMEIDFVSFAGLVDALGGVTIDFPNPAQDEASGLFVPEAGDVELDGDQALAYVRVAPLHRDDQRRAGRGRHRRPRAHPAPADVPARRLRRAERVEEPVHAARAWPAAWPRACASTTRCRCSTPCASPGACAALEPEPLELHDDGRPQRVGRGADPRRGVVPGRPRRRALTRGRPRGEPPVRGTGAPGVEDAVGVERRASPPAWRRSRRASGRGRSQRRLACRCRARR